MKKIFFIALFISQYIYAQPVDSAAVQTDSSDAAEKAQPDDSSAVENQMASESADTTVETDHSADTVSVEESPAADEPPVEEVEKPAEKKAPVKSGSASAARPKPAAKETKSEEKTDSGEEKEEAGEGFAFNPGMSFGTMTHNGNTWTRFSFRPDISIGKLGVALDLEIFMNEDQEFDSYGWKFDTFENGMESMARKVYYVRWAHPGDKLYLKGGSLDGITLGYGLVMNNYGNTAQYPDKKLLGLHGQINGLPILDANLEIVLNSFSELTQGKGVIGSRASVAPLSGMPLPLISKLRFGTSIVTDLDQYAVLLDRDGDDCPDGIDKDDGNDAVCRMSTDTYKAFQNGRKNNIINQNQFDSLIIMEEADASSLKDTYEKGDQFSLMSFDAGLPILSMSLISLEVYSEIAFQLYQNSDDFFDGGYGLILPGAAARLGPVRASLEYRMFKMPFFPGHFNAMYEAERAGILGQAILTKEEKYWSGSSENSKGIYGSADVDLRKIITVGGSYKMMFPENSGNQEGYSARAALGELITKFIPKVSSGEVFWVKEKVGQDRNPDGEPGSKDGFLDPSIYTYAGYALGMQAGSNLTVTVRNIKTWSRDENKKLTSETNLAFETAITF